MTEAAPGFTAGLAAWAAGFDPAAAPEAVAARAKAAILDTLGVIVAGCDEAPARIARDLAAEDGGAAHATCLGSGLRTAPEAAAEVNGIAGHVLDYDDVSRSGFAHASVVILPAVLAVAEWRGAGGRALLGAYVVGIEVLAKLGMATGMAHYGRGWHSTSTLGGIAAAAACARLLDLPPAGIGHAMAIAFSQAAGTRRNFGTMAKSFHAGHAARCGVHAARLAARGFDGSADPVEGPAGLLELYGGAGADLAAIADALGQPFELLDPGLSHKKYPCCFATHRAADAVLDLAAAPAPDAASIAGIEVLAPIGSLGSLIRHAPRSGLEAKFSLPFVAAAALLDRGLAIATFSDAALARPEVRALMARVSVAEDFSQPRYDYPVEQGHVAVTLALHGGARVTATVGDARGSPARPLSAAEMAAKFRDCTAALPERAASTAMALVERLETLASVSPLAAALAPAPR